MNDASARKRKFATVVQPPEDEINSSVESLASHKSLRLQFDDDTSSGDDGIGLGTSIKVRFSAQMTMINSRSRSSPLMLFQT